ncbi:MAG: hypothetical protein JXB30_11515 [Anaerolineae bacterium]|nr:hypothetical protein [Anaerolineae bacterium]
MSVGKKTLIVDASSEIGTAPAKVLACGSYIVRLAARHRASGFQPMALT